MKDLSDETIRVLGVRLHNFKNTEYGKIDFHIDADPRQAVSDICGIYGQNGSGKTAVIDALASLQCALSGLPLPDSDSEYIRISAKEFTVEFTFRIAGPEEIEYFAEYSFSVERGDDNLPALKSEMLSVRTNSGSKLVQRRHPVFLYDRGEPGSELFAPKKSRQRLLKGKKEEIERLRDARAVCASCGTSFLFSEAMLSCLSRDGGETELAALALRLRSFAEHELLVVDKWQPDRVFATPMLPVVCRHDDPSNNTQKPLLGVRMISLDKPSVMLPEDFNELERLLQGVEPVVTAIVPGLRIGIQKVGERLADTGEKLVQFELISRRGNDVLPFRYESSGIRRLFSLLSLLVYAYNETSACVVIDELDAGIFEYLLGEILAVFDESGAGQLIFTSHNLRPLELLRKEHLVFTTIDPTNRYVPMRRLRAGANKRDAYYGNIVIGSADGPQYYDAASRGRLEHAVGEAWRSPKE